MRALLKIEAVGHDDLCKMRFCASIIDDAIIQGLGSTVIGNQNEWKRWGVWEVLSSGKNMPVYGRTDYSKANSRGSRGVFIIYELESGKRYFIKSPKSWRSIDEYMCHVTEEGEIVKE